MFSKEDYEEYFNTILKLENDMIQTLENAICEIEDESIKTILLRIKEDERKHANLSEELFKFL